MSKILNLIGQLVEPGIESIEVREIHQAVGSKSGFVVVFIPASEGSPRRSRKDWKFYLRIGSGTYPMEYFQIEERFGKRPPPRLELYLEVEGIKRGYNDPHIPERSFVLGLRNRGSGIAKFPSIRYLRSCGLTVNRFGIDGCMGFGLQQSPSENEWATFRGGVNDVIYPNETRKIAKLFQSPEHEDTDIWFFKPSNFQCEISCEGAPTITVEREVAGENARW